MKTLKFALCFLFVTIVSNNCFSQDTTFYTYATVVFEKDKTSGDIGKVLDSYYEIVKVTPKKDYVVFDNFKNNQYDTLYKIIDHYNRTENGNFLDIYKCTDLKGIVCFIYFRKTDGKTVSIQIHYTNAVFTFLVNN